MPRAAKGYVPSLIIICYSAHITIHRSSAKSTAASLPKGRKRAIILIPETPPRTAAKSTGVSVRKFLELQEKYPHMTECVGLYMCHCIYTDSLNRAEYEETVAESKRSPSKKITPCALVSAFADVLSKLSLCSAKKGRPARSPTPEESDEEEVRYVFYDYSYIVLSYIL